MSPQRENTSRADGTEGTLGDVADLFGSRRSPVAASAAVVNRTHRVVRERAQLLHSRRSRARSLWLPMAVSAAFFVFLSIAIWSLVEGYESLSGSVPDSSSPFLLSLLWFFPVSATVFVVAWAYRTGADRESLR